MICKCCEKQYGKILQTDALFFEFKRIREEWERIWKKIK